MCGMGLGGRMTMMRFICETVEHINNNRHHKLKFIDRSLVWEYYRKLKPNYDEITPKHFAYTIIEMEEL